MILSNLSKSFLQESIGPDILDQLENILPSLNSEKYDPNLIYKKDTLIKIFLSFYNYKIMQSEKFMHTVLNSTPEADLDEICRAVGIDIGNMSFSQKRDALAGKGWKDPDFCESFSKAAGLPSSFIPVPKENFISEEEMIPSENPYRPLLDYQFSVYFHSIRLLDIINQRFIIQMPTGSGKTKTCMEIIADYFNKISADGIIVWLAHSEELCEQAVACFKDIWEHKSQRRLNIIKYYNEANEPVLKEDRQIFLVAGFQKVHALLKREEFFFKSSSNRIKLIIVDEAHKAVAPTYRAVISSLLGDGTRLIGLTATPGRMLDRESENKELADTFFNRIITIKTEKDKSVIKHLRDKKVLSRAVFEPLLTNLRYELTAKEKLHLEKFYDFPEGFLSRLEKDNGRNFEIVKKLEKELRSGNPQTVFFGCNIVHSKFICSLLTYMGIKAVHIDGSTDKPARRKYIEDFRHKEIQVICNYGILATGFDAPQTELVFIARPTRSIVLYSQMIGRGLRGPSVGGTEKCKIITVKDNIEGLPNEDDIYTYFEEYFENS